MRVLITDDSKTILRILDGLIKQKYPLAKIDTALDGIIAYNYIRNNTYDLIITDWNMPNLNGLELVKRIRADKITTPIWMITTEGGKSEVVEALRAGVNNYIVKPIAKDTLYTKLDELF